MPSFSDQPMSPTNIAVFYAREDQDLWQELQKHLRVLGYSHQIRIQDASQFAGGVSLAEAHSEAVATADIVLFLVSADFLASSHYVDEVLPQALARRARSDTPVVPIYVRTCDYSSLRDLAALQALPTNTRAVTTWDSHDNAWAEVVSGIEHLLLRSPTFAGSANRAPTQREDNDYELLAREQLRLPAAAYTMLSSALLISVLAAAAVVLSRYGVGGPLWLFLVFCSMSLGGLGIMLWSIRPRRSATNNVEPTNGVR